jgi:hypothetical protein
MLTSKLARVLCSLTRSLATLYERVKLTRARWQFLMIVALVVRTEHVLGLILPT